MDTKVLMTQQWLNETYAGTSGYSAVDEDGITGMGTIRALIWALQTELGISADGVFGDGTAKAFTALSTESDSSITTINHQIHILQGALYCKGQGLDPIYLNGVYTDTTKEAVRKFQEYAGLSTTDQTGIANAEVMKALLNTDAYTAGYSRRFGEKAHRLRRLSSAHGGVRLCGETGARWCYLIPCARAGKTDPAPGFHTWSRI